MNHPNAGRALALVCVLALLLLEPVAAAAHQTQALVYVSLASAHALDLFEATGLPVYAQAEGSSGAYLLTVTDAAGLHRLTAAGLAPRVLDADIAGATYYFAIVPPGRPEPRWSAHSIVLLQDSPQTLIRATPANAATLAEQGVELVQLVLAPIVVQRPQPAQLAASATIAADPLVRGMIDQVTATALTSYDAQFSGETPVTIDGAPYFIPTRHTSSGTSIEEATQFVGEHMKDLGLTVEYQDWTRSGYTNRNVIGERTGTTNAGDIYIIGAHLDDMPAGSTAPGADDNGSGSAATLVAADILSQYGWGCTLRFAFWTGEEQGLLGSSAYATRAKDNGESIKGYLNLDMLGYNAAPPRNVDLYYQTTPAGSEQIADAFMDVVSAYGLDLTPIKYNVASYATGKRSDNASFWNQGYPAILAIEDYEGHDFTPYYHTTSDTLATLDTDYLTTVVKAVVGTFVHLSGCLLTGDLEGNVTASHDSSAIAGASVMFTDAHAQSYATDADVAGHFSRVLPVATYDVTASAYGYLATTIAGVSLPTDGLTLDFALQAAPPVAPPVNISAGEGAVRLTWSHVPPNIRYTVHRGTDPYFTPTPVNLQESWEMPFIGLIIYDDPAATGDRFYAMVASNAAGTDAPASRVGIFNFELQPGG